MAAVSSFWGWFNTGYSIHHSTWQKSAHYKGDPLRFSGSPQMLKLQHAPLSFISCFLSLSLSLHFFLLCFLLLFYSKRLPFCLALVACARLSGQKHKQLQNKRSNVPDAGPAILLKIKNKNKFFLTIGTFTAKGRHYIKISCKSYRVYNNNQTSCHLLARCITTVCF